MFMKNASKVLIEMGKLLRLLMDATLLYEVVFSRSHELRVELACNLGPLFSVVAEDETSGL